MASATESTNVIDETPISLETVASSSDGISDRPTNEGVTQSEEASWPSDLRQEVVARGVSWGIFGWIVLLHLGVLAAPFTFTWQGLVALVVLHWFTGGIGICLGYHRLLTHGSFRTYAPIRHFLALVGGLSGEGSALEWVANHRKHHAFSDDEGDPHSPHDGGWWSHIIWFFWHKPAPMRQAYLQRWTPDLLKDPMMEKIAYLFIPSIFGLGFFLILIGVLLEGWGLAVSLVVWGIFVRMVFVMHSTWFVNSASHIWGYRNYVTKDNSRNLWWVAAVSYGEGWHNNHHAYPSMANHGHRWWELDMTFWVIRGLERLGLAWDVVDYKQRQDP